MSAPERPAIVTLRGTGGAVFEMELPLQFHIGLQVEKGTLRPVDRESAEALVAAGYRSAD